MKLHCPRWRYSRPPLLSHVPAAVPPASKKHDGFFSDLISPEFDKSKNYDGSFSFSGSFSPPLLPLTPAAPPGSPAGRSTPLRVGNTTRQSRLPSGWQNCSMCRSRSTSALTGMNKSFFFVDNTVTGPVRSKGETGASLLRIRNTEVNPMIPHISGPPLSKP
jgi:hypothetical protein